MKKVKISHLFFTVLFLLFLAGFQDKITRVTAGLEAYQNYFYQGVLLFSLIALVILLYSIRALRRLLNELRREMSLSMLLSRLVGHPSAGVFRSGSSKDLLQNISDSVVQSIGLSVAFIFRFHPDFRNTRIVACSPRATVASIISAMTGENILHIPVIAFQPDSRPFQVAMEGGAYFGPEEWQELFSEEKNVQESLLAIVRKLNVQNMYFSIFFSDKTPVAAILCGTIRREFTPHQLLFLERLKQLSEMLLEGVLRREVQESYMEKLTEEKNRLNALHTIDLAIAGSMDLKLILEILLDQVINQLKVDAADVRLLNPISHMLEFASGKGFRTKDFPSIALRLGDGLAGKVALERRFIAIPDCRLPMPDVETNPYPMHSESFVAYFAVPLIAKGETHGVLEVFQRKPFTPPPEWLNFLESVGTLAAVAIDNARLWAKLLQSLDDLRNSYDDTLEGWVRLLDMRDKETEYHTQRVTEMTVRIARAMGYSTEEIEHIRRGALLHDIGKIAIPDAILFKPGSLNGEEWEIVKKHPVYAYEVLYPVSFLRPALDIPYCHHERWDGSGYPRGLKGEEIPLPARIFAVVDVWDALLSDRPYRKAMSLTQTLQLIRENSGKHFDPKVVEIFLKTEW